MSGGGKISIEVWFSNHKLELLKTEIPSAVPVHLLFWPSIAIDLTMLLNKPSFDVYSVKVVPSNFIRPPKPDPNHLSPLESKDVYDIPPKGSPSAMV